MKLALFKDVKYDWSTPTVWEADDEHGVMEGYSRVSEIVEVEFSPLPKEDVVQQSLNALNVQEQKLREEFQKHLNGIQNRRAELQSLTYVPAAESQDIPF